MAKTKTSFKKGQSGNLAGRPKLLPELREIPLITADEIKRKVSACFRMDEESLLAITNDKLATSLNYCLAKQMLLARSGAKAEFDFLLNRCVGKVKDTMELLYPEPVIVKRSDGSKIEMTTKRIEE